MGFVHLRNDFKWFGHSVRYDLHMEVYLSRAGTTTFMALNASDAVLVVCITVALTTEAASTDLKGEMPLRESLCEAQK